MTSRRCAVLGDPIDHSLSPVLHRAAYAALGLDWTYDAVRVPSGGLGAFLDSLDPTWRGLSLTMPLKREAVPLLDSLDDWARLAGAANTVVLDGVRHGARHGANTDVTGAMAVLAGRTLTRALVLGGGATATSVLLALAELGCTRATLAVRTPARAAETLDAVRRHPRPPAVEVTTLAAPLPEADVVVSTVPASAQTQDLVARCLAPVVFEVVYDPWPTPLAAAATAEGRDLVTGLDLLVAQAVDQVRLMTGERDVPVEAMRSAGSAALAARRP